MRSERKGAADHFTKPWLLVASLLVASASHSAPEADSRSQWDVEVDPTAYALRGYSVHVGFNSGHMRYDLGAYAADVPQWVQSSDGFKVSMRGVGIKALYFFDKTHWGWFAGAGIGPTREHIENRDTGERTARTLNGFGVEAGYRFDLGDGIYATPWFGLNYMPQARDVALGRKTYTEMRTLPFAAVHLGYRF